MIGGKPIRLAPASEFTNGNGLADSKFAAAKFAAAIAHGLCVPTIAVAVGVNLNRYE